LFSAIREVKQIGHDRHATVPTTYNQDMRSRLNHACGKARVQAKSRHGQVTDVGSKVESEGETYQINEAALLT